MPAVPSHSRVRHRAKPIPNSTKIVVYDAARAQRRPRPQQGRYSRRVPSFFVLEEADSWELAISRSWPSSPSPVPFVNQSPSRRCSGFSPERASCDPRRAVVRAKPADGYRVRLPSAANGSSNRRVLPWPTDLIVVYDDGSVMRSSGGGPAQKGVQGSEVPVRRNLACN